MELTAIAKEPSKTFSGTEADGDVDGHSMSNDMDAEGFEEEGHRQSRGLKESLSADFNEDSGQDDNDLISRQDHIVMEEHMVSRKEDNWLKTFAGVAGNVLEW